MSRSVSYKLFVLAIPMLAQKLSSLQQKGVVKSWSWASDDPYAFYVEVRKGREKEFQQELNNLKKQFIKMGFLLSMPFERTKAKARARR